MQNTKDYKLEGSLFSTGTEVNVINKQIKTPVAFFEIKDDWDGITYDLNGNSFDCKLDGYVTRMRIAENTTFTLKSSVVVDEDKNGIQDGEIRFNMPETFESNAVFKYIDLGDFVNAYPKYRSLTTFIESREGEAKCDH